MYRGRVNLPVVSSCHAYSFVDGLEHIFSYKLLFAEDLYSCSISIQQLPMLCDLRELDLGHVHKCIDLEFGALEVFNAESVYSDDLDTRLVADLKNLDTTVS